MDEPKEKKPRGRPRKNPPAEPKEKKPRGRPRKNPPAEPKEKKPRGRPRKNPPAEPKEKKPRGRPRKNPPSEVKEKKSRGHKGMKCVKWVPRDTPDEPVGLGMSLPQEPPKRFKKKPRKGLEETYKKMYGEEPPVGTKSAVRYRNPLAPKLKAKL